MTAPSRSLDEARLELYDIVQRDDEFEQKAQAALELGERYLGVDNAHLARVDRDADLWEALVSTDPPDGTVPPGLTLDLQTTYCRRVLAEESSIALHDAPEQGWRDDSAFEAHDLHCYHGTPITLDGEVYGTVCFVSESPRAEPFDDSETLFAELIARLLEHELRLRRQEAETTRRANSISVLSRVLRHNLRNEMTVVRGRVNLLVDRLGDQVEDESTTAETLLESIDRIIALSDKARKLESVVSTRFEQEPVAIDALLERVVADVTADRPDADITLEGPTDVTIRATSSLELALTELVENAVKHGGDDPEVVVSVAVGSETVELAVTDDGPGLPRQERDVLANGVETPLIHGSGLGLWMVYWIVTNHDGAIDATVTDDGTTVTVTLPHRTTEGEGTITREQTVQALRRGRDRFEAVFEESFDGMVLVNDDRRIVDANQRAADLVGRSKRDLLGRAVREFADESFELADAWDQLQATGKHEGEFPLVTADGTERVLEYTATADIVPGQHLFVGRDVTERLERERELRETTQRLEALIETSPDPIFVLDAEGAVQVWNEAAEDVFGYTADEVVGEPLDTLDVHNETERSAFERRFERALAGESFSNLEVERTTKEGNRIHLSISTAPLRDPDGTVTGLIAIARDVTELNVHRERLGETNRQLETILSTVEAAIFIKDAEGRYELMNRKCRELLGLDPDEDIVGLTDDDVFPAEEAARIRAQDERVLEGGETVEIEETLPTSRGTRTYLTLKSPIFDEAGDPSGICAVATDITAREERDQLRRRNDRLDEFATIVSHDLRNPLNVLDGALRLTAETGDLDNLDRCRRAVDRMQTLVDDLLVLAREGEAVDDPEAVDLAGIAADCWQNVDTDDATLTVTADGVVRADRSRLKQLLENLFRNAVEHVGPEVTVTIGDLDRRGFYLEDDGPGVSLDERDRVFERGYSTSSVGTGFGLAIVEAIAEAHGWEVRLTDGDTGGVRFEFTGVDVVE